MNPISLIQNNLHNLMTKAQELCPQSLTLKRRCYAWSRTSIRANPSDFFILSPLDMKGSTSFCNFRLLNEKQVTSLNEAVKKLAGDAPYSSCSMSEEYDLFLTCTTDDKLTQLTIRPDFIDEYTSKNYQIGGYVLGIGKKVSAADGNTYQKYFTDLAFSQDDVVISDTTSQSCKRISEYDYECTHGKGWIESHLGTITLVSMATLSAAYAVKNTVDAIRSYPDFKNATKSTRDLIRDTFKSESDSDTQKSQAFLRNVLKATLGATVALTAITSAVYVNQS